MKKHCRITLHCIFVIALVIALSGCAGKKSRETALYISLSGNDSWSGKLPEPNTGTTDGPFATLKKAREVIRALKQDGPLPEGGVTVYLREGVYPLSETFKLTSEDSGTEAAPVIWRAFHGEKVQLVGGKEVTGFEPIDNRTAYTRIDKAYRDRILKVDLKARGITNYGEITNRGGPGMELFFQGKRMMLARWPNDGWTQIADVPQTGNLVFKGVLPHMRHGIPAGRHYGRFTYEGDRPNRWSNINEVFLHGYWVWDWYDEFLKIESIDTRKREIAIKEPHSHYGYCKEQRYYPYNDT